MSVPAQNGILHGGGDKKSFRVLTNFSLRFKHFIPSPSELEDWQGYNIIAMATLHKETNLGELYVYELFCNIMHDIQCHTWWTDKYLQLKMNVCLKFNVSYHECYCHQAYSYSINQDDSCILQGVLPALVPH